MKAKLTVYRAGESIEGETGSMNEVTIRVVKKRFIFGQNPVLTINLKGKKTNKNNESREFLNKNNKKKESIPPLLILLCEIF